MSLFIFALDPGFQSVHGRLVVSCPSLESNASNVFIVFRTVLLSLQGSSRWRYVKNPRSDRTSAVGERIPLTESQVDLVSLGVPRG